MHEREHEATSGSEGAAASRASNSRGKRPDLETQIASLAAQVRRIGERLAAGQTAAREKHAEHQATTEPRAAPSERVLAAAETVAAEIRAGAEREAARIREAAAQQRSGRIDELRATVAHHRRTVEELTSEADRIERGIAMLRAQARTLEAELRAMEAGISALEPPRL